MSDSVEKVVERFGKFVTGQVNVTYDTRQTAEQFLEIRAEGLVDDTDSVEFEIEDFLEYVRSNVSDQINQTLENFGQIGLEKEIFVLDENGVEVGGE